MYKKLTNNINKKQKLYLTDLLSYSSLLGVGEFLNTVETVFLTAISPESLNLFKSLSKIPTFTLIKTNSQLHLKIFFNKRSSYPHLLGHLLFETFDRFQPRNSLKKEFCKSSGYLPTP